MKIGFIHQGSLIRKVRLTSNQPQEIIIGRSSAADISFGEITTLSSKHLQLFMMGQQGVYY